MSSSLANVTVYADIPVFVLRIRDFLPASFDDWVLGDAGRMDSKKALRSMCLTNVTFRHHLRYNGLLLPNENVNFLTRSHNSCALDRGDKPPFLRWRVPSILVQVD